MRLQTHCELGNVVALKGVQMAVANYNANHVMNTTLIELEVVTEDETHVICQDNSKVFHAVPKGAIHNPLYSL
jgi:hypothetical protein